MRINLPRTKLDRHSAEVSFFLRGARRAQTAADRKSRGFARNGESALTRRGRLSSRRRRTDRRHAAAGSRMRISQAFLAGHCSPFRLPPSMNEREVCLTEIGFSLLLSLSSFLSFFVAQTGSLCGGGGVAAGGGSGGGNDGRTAIFLQWPQLRGLSRLGWHWHACQIMADSLYGGVIKVDRNRQEENETPVGLGARTWRTSIYNRRSAAGHTMQHIAHSNRFLPGNASDFLPYRFQQIFLHLTHPPTPGRNTAERESTE